MCVGGKAGREVRDAASGRQDKYRLTQNPASLGVRIRHEDPLRVRRSGLATKRDGLGARPYTLCVFFDRPGEVGGGRECSSNTATRAATLPPVVLRAGGGRWTSSAVMAVGDIT